MVKRIIVTGGAGFIGSHLVDELIRKGHSVKIFDNLEHQVHHGISPSYINSQAEVIIADVRDRDVLKKAIKNVEVIFHHAAMVGVGQSMYQISKYMSTNCLGTANILDVLANEKHCVEKIVVSSSMSVYGEGQYECPQCDDPRPEPRTQKQLKAKQWEMFCSNCKTELKPVETDEDKVLKPDSVYAISKRDQEEMCLTFGRAYQIPTVALRYFNGYGTRQSLSNPYTGVCAIFCSRFKNDSPPLIFEDGNQKRDFVHVLDIVQANILAMEKKECDYQVFNVGSGKPITILELAEVIKKVMGSDIEPQTTDKFRVGDIRHCFGDISKIKKSGYQPKISIEDGMQELLEWTKSEQAQDHFDSAWEELDNFNLVV